MKDEKLEAELNFLTWAITPNEEDAMSEQSKNEIIVEGIMGSKRTAAYQNEVKPKKRQTAATQPHENQTGAVRLDDVPSF